jgi:hypothetical protein
VNVVSEYNLRCIKYDNHLEMREGIKEMKADGWKTVSLSYNRLRVRFKKGTNIHEVPRQV